MKSGEKNMTNIDLKNHTSIQNYFYNAIQPHDDDDDNDDNDDDYCFF